jgi:hypothetical protein
MGVAIGSRQRWREGHTALAPRQAQSKQGAMHHAYDASAAHIAPRACHRPHAARRAHRGPTGHRPRPLARSYGPRPPPPRVGPQPPIPQSAAMWPTCAQVLLELPPPGPDSRSQAALDLSGDAGAVGRLVVTAASAGEPHACTLFITEYPITGRAVVFLGISTAAPVRYTLTRCCITPDTTVHTHLRP